MDMILSEPEAHGRDAGTARGTVAARASVFGYEIIRARAARDAVPQAAGAPPRTRDNETACRPAARRRIIASLRAAAADPDRRAVLTQIVAPYSCLERDTGKPSSAKYLQADEAPACELGGLRHGFFGDRPKRLPSSAPPLLPGGYLLDSEIDDVNNHVECGGDVPLNCSEGLR